MALFNVSVDSERTGTEEKEKPPNYDHVSGTVLMSKFC